MNKKNKKPAKNEIYKFKKLLMEITKCCEDKKLIEMRKFDLPYGELSIIYLFQDQRYLTPKELAQKLNVSKSRVTVLVKNLLKRGLINTIRDSNDKKIKLFFLTKNGQKLLLEFVKFREEIHERILMKFDETQRKAVLFALDLLRDAMEEVKNEIIEVNNVYKEVKNGK